MHTPAAITTAQALLEAGDIGHCELVRGKLVPMSPAGLEHGRIANRVAYLLTRFVSEHDLGLVLAAETGFQIASDPDTVRAPDVAFLSRERLAVQPAGGFGRGSPDLAVEVLSPDDRPGEVQTKVHDWLAAGAKQVWVVDARRRTVAVHRPAAPAHVFAGDDELAVGDLLPRLRMRAADAFA